MSLRKRIKREVKDFKRQNLPLKRRRKRPKLSQFDLISRKVNKTREKINNSGFARYMTNFNQNAGKILGGDDFL